MSRNSLIFRVIGVFLLVALVAVGGFFAYRAGVAQGVMRAPAVATAIAESAESGAMSPMPGYGHGHGYEYEYPAYGSRRFGMFPFGGICFSVFFIFLFFGLLRLVFFGACRFGWKRHHGPWRENWDDGVPPMFDEWHKKAHADSAGGEKIK